MIEKIAITDITRMAHNFICIAGVFRDGTSVRPLLEHSRFCEDWCCINGYYVRPFSVLELDFLDPRSMPPHTEDRYITPDHVVFISQLNDSKKRQLLRMMDDGNIANIFGAPLLRKKNQIAKYVQTGTGTRSLGLIKINTISDFIYEEKKRGWDFRLTFTDQSRTEYRIKIVDLSFQSLMDYKRICQGFSSEKISQYAMDHIFNKKKVYLRIGLARGWADYPECCFLQITGVYTFPGYMGNSSFQMLQQAIKANNPSNDLDDIPF